MKKRFLETLDLLIFKESRTQRLKDKLLGLLSTLEGRKLLFNKAVFV